MDIVKINDKDTVGVDLATGHKVALADMPQGTDVIKYGFPIGVATCDIVKGEHVHTHNVKTKLSGNLSYDYTPRLSPLPPREPFAIEAFVRDNGEIGIRNDVWIVPTVGCVNSLAKRLADATGAMCRSYQASQRGGRSGSRSWL